MGGKSAMAQWIIGHFPKNYVDMLYAEIFGGGGWVLFKKDPSVNEVYNDFHRQLVNLFTTIRDDFERFEHKVKWTFHSRAMFDQAKKLLDSNEINDLDRALFFLIVKVQSFSSNGDTYGYQRCLKKRNKWAHMLDRIEKIRDRMMSVNIECCDFEKMIERYDSKDTLFYCDPPYIEKEHYYKVPFGAKDHERLSSVLKQIDGKFVLSYYPHPFIDKHYKRFRKATKAAVKTSCGITRVSKIKDRPKSEELLIMNY